MIKAASSINEKTWLSPPYGKYKPMSNFIPDNKSDIIEFSTLKLNDKANALLTAYINDKYGDIGLKRIETPSMFICNGALPLNLRKDSGVTKKVVITGIFKNEEMIVLRCEEYYSVNNPGFIVFCTNDGKAKIPPKNVIYNNTGRIEVYGIVLEMAK